MIMYYLPPREIAGPQVIDLAPLDQPIQGPQGLSDGRGLIPVVAVEEVDLGRPQPPEAAVEAGQDVVAREAATVQVGLGVGELRKNLL